MQHMKNHRFVISQWLESIGRERGTSLQLEEDGHCVVPGSDGFGCIVEVPDNLDTPSVFLYCPLVQLPDNTHAQLSLISAALTMNLFGLLTGGCHLALDSRSNHLVLSFSSTIETIDDDVFQHILYEMEELSSNLRQRLEDIATPSSFASESFINRCRQDRLMTSSVTT
jgi:hypothetical protein